MPRLKLTDAAVKKILPPAAGSAIHWDTLTTGLGLRVTYGGTKTFIVQARVLKEGRWVDQKKKLGRYPTLSLAQARKDAKKELEAAQEGKQMGNIRAEREEVQIEESRNSFRYVREDFLKKYRTRQKRRPSERTLSELRRVLNHEAFSDWNTRPIAEITRRDIADAIDTFMAKGHERAANAYLRYLKMMFGWALDRDIIKADPTARIKPPGEEHSRERVLEVPEIRAIWKATAPTQAGKGDLFACIVKVLLLTGQRRSEVAGMRWCELDLDVALWTIPGQNPRRTKNGRDHLVPLSEPVIDIIAERQQEQADMQMKTEYVFTSTGKAPFSGWSRSKSRLDGRAEKALREITGDPVAELMPWTLHDARRTLVTRMSEDLHRPPHVVEAVVNHVSGVKAGVAGTYNRALYLEDRRDALNGWADYVLALAGENKADGGKR